MNNQELPLELTEHLKNHLKLLQELAKVNDLVLIHDDMIDLWSMEIEAALRRIDSDSRLSVDSFRDSLEALAIKIKVGEPLPKGLMCYDGGFLKTVAHKNGWIVPLTESEFWELVAYHLEPEEKNESMSRPVRKVR